MFSLHLGGLEVTVCIRDLHVFFICEFVDNAMLVTAVSPFGFWFSMEKWLPKGCNVVGCKTISCWGNHPFLGICHIQKTCCIISCETLYLNFAIHTPDPTEAVKPTLHLVLW